MIKKIMCLLLLGMLLAVPAFAQEMSNAELVQELKAMKVKLAALEAELQALKASPMSPDTPMEKAEAHAGGLPERVRKIEEKLAEGPGLGSWADNITLSGLVEVEAGYENMKFAAPGGG